MKETNSPVLSKEVLKVYLDSKEVRLEMTGVNTIDNLHLKIDGLDESIPLLHLSHVLDIKAKTWEPVFGFKAGRIAGDYKDLDHFPIAKGPVQVISRIIGKTVHAAERYGHLEHQVYPAFSVHPDPEVD